MWECSGEEVVMSRLNFSRSPLLQLRLQQVFLQHLLLLFLLRLVVNAQTVSERTSAREMPRAATTQLLFYLTTLIVSLWLVLLECRSKCWSRAQIGHSFYWLELIQLQALIKVATWANSEKHLNTQISPYPHLRLQMQKQTPQYDYSEQGHTSLK